MSHYPVIVIGTGSMGAATCWHLAKRGIKVLGLEQFDIPHVHGSHGGQSRIIRKAYFEHPNYVPLLERAYQGWHDIEQETGARLYHRTGIVYFGRADNANIAGVRTSARLHGITINDLTNAEAHDRFPAFRVPNDFDAIFEPDAGFVTPERAVSLFAQQASRHGATIRTRTPVLHWNPERNLISVTTPDAHYTCDKLVITAGAWTSRLLPQLKISLRVTRQLLAWVSPPRPADFSMGRLPCWFVEDPALGTFYGFPMLTEGAFDGPPGLKLAHHHPGPECEPRDINGPLPDSEKKKLTRILATYIPGAGNDIAHTRKCLYTNSSDGHFVIDHLPETDGRVVVACGFSGHGFKFVPVIGEILADLAIDGTTKLPVGFLSLTRFG